MKISIKAKIMGFTAALLVLLVSVIGSVAYYSMEKVIANAMLAKAQSDLKMAMEIVNFAYPGEWSVQEGNLCKGSANLNGNTEMVDKIGTLTGGTVTLFLGDTRVATNVQQNGARAIGTKASPTVIEQVLKKGDAYCGEAIVVGQQTLTNYLPIKNLQGEIIGMFYVGVSRAFVADLERQFYVLFFGCTAVLLVFGVIGAWYMARRIAKPIQEATQYVGEMAEGNFSIVVDNKILTLKDEIGDMARAIATMNRSMRQLLQELLQQAEQLAASSQEMTASADQSTVVSGQVADAITEVAAAANFQRGAVKTITEVIENLSSGLESVSGDAQTVKKLSNQAMDAVGFGQQAVEGAIDKMGSVEQGTEQVKVSIHELAEGAKRIGEIVNVITTISGQTNLLALNAAIEAARAGEHGKGFAVVAEEVRKLAEKSEKAAREITELIAVNAASIDQAVAAMEHGSKTVEAGIVVVKESGDRFNELAEEVEKMTDKVNAMTSVVQLIAEESNKILTDIRKIDEASRQTAGHSESVSAATEEQTAAIHEIASASQSIAKMAEELQNIARRFKVD